jgi:hypothetical protein
MVVTRIDKGGRLVIPRKLRREVGIEEGSLAMPCVLPLKDALTPLPVRASAEPIIKGIRIAIEFILELLAKAIISARSMNQKLMEF